MSETTGHNSNSQLKAIVERIERLDGEIKDLRADQKDIFAEAKSGGYDVCALRQIISLRRLTAEDRAERDAILDTYLHALGMAG